MSVPRGVVDASIDVTTSGGCKPPARAAIVRIFGRGFPRKGQNASALTTAGISNHGPFTVPLSDTFQAIAGFVNPPVRYSGLYTLQVICRDRFLAVNSYSGQIRFVTPTKWVAVPAPRTSPKGFRAAAPIVVRPSVTPVAASLPRVVSQRDGDWFTSRQVKFAVGGLLLVSAGALIAGAFGRLRWRRPAGGKPASSHAV